MKEIIVTTENRGW